MPPTILSSPLLSVPVLNTLLNNPTLAPVDRIPLLHAKITLLSNGASASTSPSGSASTSATVESASRGSQSNAHSTSTSRPSATDAGKTGRTATPSEDDLKRLREEMEARIEVAGLFMGLKPARHVEAENELTIVEARLKGLFKASRVGGDARSPGSTSDPNTTASRRGEFEELQALRIRALTDLVEVEEALGREGRAKRWRQLVSQLQEDTA